MAALIEAIDIKRKMFFEFEGAPYHCIDVEVSRPTARGGQTLVRLKMRNLLTRAVFDKTFKAGEKFAEPDLVQVSAVVLVLRQRGLPLHGSGDVRDADASAPTRSATIGSCVVDNVLVQVQKYNGSPIGIQFPPHVELTVAYTEPGVRGDTASGGVTKLATARNGSRDPRAAVHQGRRAREGAHRDAGIRRPRVVIVVSGFIGQPKRCVKASAGPVVSCPAMAGTFFNAC